MKMPLREPLCNKHDGLQTYEKENLDLEIFFNSFFAEHLWATASESRFYDLFEVYRTDSFFQIFAYHRKDYISKMLSTNTCFLL